MTSLPYAMLSSIYHWLITLVVSEQSGISTMPVEIEESSSTMVFPSQSAPQEQSQYHYTYTNRANSARYGIAFDRVPAPGRVCPDH